ncbi:hypothetical protein SGRA_0808 [Saprospira grandis str. Lewin]|uniref:Uncharacterized protein n=1 Tax=Saprospira grandis (strain Lewin) TaxID=984262 RepID=H6L209_SAPGL|nr:hypothetical protein SGRA_0808 [Saprospira grandis str. Lewin]
MGFVGLAMCSSAAQPQTEQKTCFFAQGRADLRALTTRTLVRSSTTERSNAPKKQKAASR